jgi:hypothetical protein
MLWKISMRIDLYTKGVLTVIAVLLAVIACKQYVSPDAVVQAQGAFARVQFSPGGKTHFLTAGPAKFGTTTTAGVQRLKSGG